MRRTLLRAGTTAFMATALLSCGEEASQQQAAQPGQAPPIPVGTIEVKPQPVRPGESFVGRIQAMQKVEVRARVNGFIEARLFEEGSLVQQGAPLFRIERGTYEAIVEQRRADVAAAEAQAQNAELQLQRARELIQRANISQATLDEREAAARETRASVLQARAALRQAEINLGYTEIAAPIAGRIGRANFDLGALVGPDSGPLTVIVTEDPTHVVFPVSQRRLLEAEQQARAEGLKPQDFVVTVRLSDSAVYPHQGRVDFVSPTVQRGTDTVDVRATIPNPDGLLRDGQFVQVTVSRSESQMALVVPQAAVQADRQGQFVLVVTPEKTIEVRRIETGDTLDRGNITVRTGLKEGDAVVVQGLQRVQPGSPVEPQMVEPVSGTPAR
jgi:membrane fusion protein (multidrug efflux system)